MDVPPGAFLGVNAFGQGADETRVVVRLAPPPGKAVRWLGTELAVVDTATGAMLQRVPLDMRVAAGSVTVPGLEPEFAIAYGPYVETAFMIARRVPETELRFPPVEVDGTVVPVPALHLTDKARVPVPVLVLPQH